MQDIDIDDCTKLPNSPRAFVCPSRSRGTMCHFANLFTIHPIPARLVSDERPDLLGPWISSPRRALDRHTALGGPGVDGLRPLLGIGVDSHIDEGVDSTLDGGTEQADLQGRVVSVSFAHV